MTILLVDGPLTLTLSNVEVFSCVVSWLHTRKPMYALDAIDSVVVPTCVQLVPFAETYPVTTEPMRVSFSHVGGAWVAQAYPVGRMIRRRAPFAIGTRNKLSCAVRGGMKPLE